MDKTLKVLLVEDSADDADLILLQLNRAGYRVSSERVQTQAAMEEALEHGDWDLILSDYALPAFSGMKALEIFKSRQLEIPFIIISGQIGETTAVQAMKAGVHDYLMKDNLTRLVPAVERELREAHLRREHKRAEKELREREALIRYMDDHAPVMIGMADETGEVIYFNRTWLDFRGTTFDEEADEGWSQGLHPDDRDRVLAEFEAAKRERRLSEMTYRIRRADGNYRWVQNTSVPCYTDDGRFVGFTDSMIDITEKKEAEEVLRASEDRFRTLVQNISDIIILLNADGMFMYVSPSIKDTLGHESESLIGKNPYSYVHPDDHDILRESLARIASNASPNIISETRFRRADGSWAYLESVGVNLLSNPGIHGMLITARDITERKRSEQELMEVNRALKATSQCNQALVRATEENSLLQEICRIIVETGDYYFAWVGFLQKDNAVSIKPVARYGFEDGYLDILKMNMTDEIYKDCASVKAIRTLNPVIIQDVNEDKEQSVWSAEALKRGYGSMMALPLAHGGEVFGSLVIIARQVGAFDRNEVTLLAEMADDLAFGIHTIRGRAARKLAESALEKSNADLAYAYDATLEGWSRALELRERETAGHSQRVVALTLYLAKTLGASDEDTIHIRRGALLHDIGKMGIPDSILLKPGPLSEDEWIVMRQHPAYAFQLLAGIPYLLPALDIPFCHHERWDGSGYPRGLHGKQIPLAARIFAVVDVWDALTSNRPYRPAWREADALIYLKEQSGKQFDPLVVDTFLQHQMQIEGLG